MVLPYVRLVALHPLDARSVRDVENSEAFLIALGCLLYEGCVVLLVEAAAARVICCHWGVAWFLFLFLISIKKADYNREI